MSAKEELDKELSENKVSINHKIIRDLFDPLIETESLDDKLALFEKDYFILKSSLSKIIRYLKPKAETRNVFSVYQSLFVSFRMFSINLYRTITSAPNNADEFNRKSRIGMHKVIMAYLNTKYYLLVENKYSDNKKLFLLLSSHAEEDTAFLFSPEILEIFNCLINDGTYLPLPVFACTSYIFSSLMDGYSFSGIHYSGHSNIESIVFYERSLSSTGFANLINCSGPGKNPYYDFLYFNSCYSNTTMTLINRYIYEHSLSYISDNDYLYAFEFSTALYDEYISLQSFFKAYKAADLVYPHKMYLADLIFD